MTADEMRLHWEGVRDYVKSDKDKCFKVYIFTPGMMWAPYPIS